MAARTLTVSVPIVAVFTKSVPMIICERALIKIAENILVVKRTCLG